MVVDINVKWDGMTEAEEQAQYNGREKQVPEAGYVFYNAEACTFLRAMHASWDTPELLHEPFRDWPLWYEGCYAWSPRCAEPLRRYQSRLCDTLETDFKTIIKDDEDREYFVEELENWVILIQFILDHTNKPGLRVEFT